jgi:hypothetical protein
MADPLYMPVAEIKTSIGLTTEELAALGGDTELEKLVRACQRIIELVCRQWFFSKEMEMWVDGSGGDYLFFGVPIIRIDEVRLNGSATALETSRYKWYTEVNNPRISLVSPAQYQPNIFNQPFDYVPNVFQSGSQNTYVKGAFGFLEGEGVEAAAPLLIQRALCLLVAEKVRGVPLNPAVSAVAAPPPMAPGILRDEWVDGHRRRFDPAAGKVSDRKPWISGLTNNPEVMQILRAYRAPIGLATPRESTR